MNLRGLSPSDEPGLFVQVVDGAHPFPYFRANLVLQSPPPSASAIVSVSGYDPLLSAHQVLLQAVTGNLSRVRGCFRAPKVLVGSSCPESQTPELGLVC